MRLLFKLSIFFLLALGVVIPNSLQVTTAATLGWCALLSLHLSSLRRSAPQLLVLYSITVAVTVVYILVGLVNLAPWVAAQQTTVIYIISPLLWMIVAAAMFNVFGEQKIVKWLAVAGAAGVATVAIFFYLFLTGGPEAVAFFKEDANVNVEEGYAAATMLVYGSMIFLCAAFFAAPSTIPKPVPRILLLFALTAAAITSGRSALILSIPIGIGLGVLFPSSSRKLLKSNGRTKKRSLVDIVSSSPLLCAAIAAVAMLVIATAYGINVLMIVADLFEEISEGGGSARSEQFVALLKGAYENNGLGSGHGIGLPDLVRNDFFPWRYEMVWVATIFRVGVIGALIYAAPFVIYIFAFLKFRRAFGRSDIDLFFFAGFVASFLASNTNPYIESFGFQWMFIFPMVGLSVKYQKYRKEKIAAARAHSRQFLVRPETAQ